MRAQLAEALERERESGTLFRTAFVTSPESMSIAGLYDARFVEINEGFERMFGWPREQVIDHTAFELDLWVDPTDRLRLLNLLELGHGTCEHFETKYRRKDGRIFDGFVAAKVIELHGKRCLMSATRDVTERKLIDAELAEYRSQLESLVASRTAEIEAMRDELARRAQAAEAANSAKSEFLQHISHEIRTPMNVIIGFADLLHDSPLTEEQARHLEFLRSAGKHLLSLLNDMLDFARIEAGRIEFECVPLTIAALMAETRDLMAAAAAKKGLELVVEDAAGDLRVLGDPTRLRQSLLNLASNAVKFTQTGRVTLRVECQTSNELEAVLRFSVQDTGIGIPPDKLDRLFLSFEQVDASIARRFGGTGLGLAITRRLAALMGGDAGAYSETGVGSTFWFTVRLALAGARETDSTVAPR